jgi:hypothetical protein
MLEAEKKSGSFPASHELPYRRARPPVSVRVTRDKTQLIRARSRHVD